MFESEKLIAYKFIIIRSVWSTQVAPPSVVRRIVPNTPTAVPLLASEKLDIRPYEAADECSTDIPQIRVTVNDVGSGGILTVGLYDNPKHFLKKKGLKRRIRVPATEEQHTICFNHEEQGTYAVAAYHDKDGNRKINRRWNLMPAEPFGLSNNPEQHFGFPEFSDSAFMAGGSVSTVPNWMYVLPLYAAMVSRLRNL